MVNTIKVEPVEPTDDTLSEDSATSDSIEDHHARFEAEQLENSDEKTKQDSDTPSRTKTSFKMVEIKEKYTVYNIRYVIYRSQYLDNAFFDHQK